MAPGFAWALLVVLTFDTAIPPTLSWYATQDECRIHAAVKVTHYTLTNRPVSYVECRRVRVAD